MIIGFIGLGNMAKAMIGGFLKEGLCDKGDIIGSSKTENTARKVQEIFGIATTTSNRDIARSSDIIILAVKPNFYQEVIEEIKDTVTTQVIVSIAAGKTMDWIQERFGRHVRLVRCMPNTPALVGEACTAVTYGEGFNDVEKQVITALLASFGKITEVPERLMDTVVGVSGSSPAYVFLFIEAMADAAVLGGMPRKQAYEMAAQAVLGSAKMVLETGIHPGELKDMVCSPGGTTIEAVKILEEKNFRGAVIDAVTGCIEKSKKL